jgi:hypothetical protein
MRRILRIINALFWAAAWLAIAIQDSAFSDPPRLLGEAVGVAILWFAIDLTIKRRRTKNSN